MPINPMQQQQSPDMLMAIMTDSRATPQQRMAAMSALNAMRGGANAPPQMTGDSTGVSQISPEFMNLVRQQVMSEEQPQQQENQQKSDTTSALMAGAADADRVAAMAMGGAVKGYAEGEEVIDAYSERMKKAKGNPFLSQILQSLGEGKEQVNKSIYELMHGEGSFNRQLAKARGEPAPFEYDGKPFVPLQPGLTPRYNFREEVAEPVVEPVVEPAVAAVPPTPPAAGPEGPPPPAAIEPGKPTPEQQAMLDRQQADADAYKERMDKLLSDDQPLSAQDKWMALARAGFATAAGSSPRALQNIGAGLGKGLESLDELRKERAVNRMKQATLLQSQRSEELAAKDRERAAGIQQQLVDLKGKELEADLNPNSMPNKVRAAQIQNLQAEAQLALQKAVELNTSNTDLSARGRDAKAFMNEWNAAHPNEPITLMEAYQKTGAQKDGRATQAQLINAYQKLVEAEVMTGVPAHEAMEKMLADIERYLKQGASPSALPSSKGEPPPDARKAPDGNYYIPDPNRPGKYMMWNPS